MPNRLIAHIPHTLVCLLVTGALVTLTAAGCADPLISDDPLEQDEQPPPAVVIDEGDEPVDGSTDAAVTYTFEVDLRIAEQLYVIGEAQFDGAIDVIVPSGDVEAFSDWSNARNVSLYGPRATFLAVMQAADVSVIEELLGAAMEAAGPVCAACGFECRVLATNEVGCLPTCDQCGAGAILDADTGIQLPNGQPGYFHTEHEEGCGNDCF